MICDWGRRTGTHLEPPGPPDPHGTLVLAYRTLSKTGNKVCAPMGSIDGSGEMGG